MANRLPPYLQKEFYVQNTPPDGDCYFSSVFFSMFTFEAGQERLKGNLTNKEHNFRSQWLKITRSARDSNRAVNEGEFEQLRTLTVKALRKVAADAFNTVALAQKLQSYLEARSLGEAVEEEVTDKTLLPVITKILIDITPSINDKIQGDEISTYVENIMNSTDGDNKEAFNLYLRWTQTDKNLKRETDGASVPSGAFLDVLNQNLQSAKAIIEKDRSTAASGNLYYADDSAIAAIQKTLNMVSILIPSGGNNTSAYKGDFFNELNNKSFFIISLYNGIHYDAILKVVRAGSTFTRRQEGNIIKGNYVKSGFTFEELPQDIISRYCVQFAPNFIDLGKDLTKSRTAPSVKFCGEELAQLMVQIIEYNAVRDKLASECDKIVGEPSNDTVTQINDLKEEVETRFADMQKGYQNNKLELNPQIINLKNRVVTSCSRKTESAEQKAKAAAEEEERTKAEAAAHAKLAESAAEKAEAKKAAAEKADAKKREAEIQAAISPLQMVAKKQILELKNIINQWKRKESELKEEKVRLEKYNLTVQDESNLLDVIKSSELVSSGSKEKKKQITNEEKAERSRITKELKEYRNFNNANIRYSKAFKNLARVALQFFKLRNNSEQSITNIDAALEKIRNEFTKSPREGVGEEESPTERAQPELPTTADLYQEFQDRIKNLDDPFVTYLFQSRDLTENNSVLGAFAQSYRPKGSKIDKFQNMNTEIRGLLLRITPDPYANVHQEQLNLLTDNTLTSKERYAISNEINRTTQSIIAPYLQAVEGTLVTTKSGGGKRQRKNTATRKRNAKRGRKSNSARGNRSGTRRRGRFARSRSLPRRKLTGCRDRSQKVRSKPNQRTRRPQRK